METNCHVVRELSLFHLFRVIAPEQAVNIPHTYYKLYTKICQIGPPPTS